LSGALLVAIDQHHVDAGARRDIADAGAHETGADDGEFFSPWSAARSADAAHPCSVPASTGNRLRIIAAASLAAQDLREVARFDPQGGVDRQLQSFVDALH